MKVVFHKNFDKAYIKLSSKIQKKVDVAIEQFRLNPLNKSLRNHILKGSMAGKRAISVTGDYRIIFEEFDDYVLVVMLDVGTHSQVY